VLVLAVAAVAVAPAAAQQRGGGRGMGGGGGTLGLLAQKSVQDDLKLSVDQAGKVKELAAKQREAMQGLGDLSQEERRQKMQDMNKANDKAVAEILTPEQTKRLKQIRLQVSMRQGGGIAAFNNPEVVQALSLTDEQKEKLKAIGEDVRKEMADLRQGGGEPAEMRKKMEELNKSTHDKAMAVLTDEQKTKLKDLAGEPFKGELQFGRPGGGRRPGGAGGGGGGA
jgi:Spy/CpxP family protein refolding chaperone